MVYYLNMMLPKAANKIKHDIDFEEVQVLWEDQQARSFEAMAVLGEQRDAMIGKIHGKLWTVIYTKRGNRIRLISARRAREKERDLYEKTNTTAN
jgi:uncharacterized DUF497 family protein